MGSVLREDTEDAEDTVVVPGTTGIGVFVVGAGPAAALGQSAATPVGATGDTSCGPDGA